MCGRAEIEIPIIPEIQSCCTGESLSALQAMKGKSWQWDPKLHSWCSGITAIPGHTNTRSIQLKLQI